jgi:hypothetical protein
MQDPGVGDLDSFDGWDAPDHLPSQTVPPFAYMVTGIVRVRGEKDAVFAIRFAKIATTADASLLSWPFNAPLEKNTVRTVPDLPNSVHVDVLPGGPTDVRILRTVRGQLHGSMDWEFIASAGGSF